MSGTPRTFRRSGPAGPAPPLDWDAATGSRPTPRGRRALAHPELDALSPSVSAEKFAALESRLTQALEAARESKESTFGSFDLLVARIGQRTNDIMKVLTLVTVVLLPSTVLAGIMGMNFQVGLFNAVVALLARARRDARHRLARTLSRPQSPLDLSHTGFLKA